MIRIAQIGVGYWGPNLLRNLVSNKDCRVEMVVDLDKERRNFAKNLYPSIQVTDKASDVFENKKIDAVVIATPIATHFDLAHRALEAGKHVLIEKPMAQTVHEIDQIESAAKKKSLIAMAGHTFLYNAAVHSLKELVDSGELGEMRYIYGQRLNLGRIRSDADALWTLAPHDISIVQYLFNDVRPLSVSIHGMDYVQRGIQDVVFIDLIYPKKVMVHLHVSWLDPHKIRRMTLVGSKKMAVYDDMAEHKIAIYDKGIDRMAVLGQNMDFDESGTPKFNHRSGDVYFPKINFEEPLKVEIAHFLDCITRRIPCLTGPAHAREVVRILSGKID